MGRELSRGQPKWVQKVGALGGWAYAAASFVAAYTGLTIGAIVIAIGGYFASAAGWLSLPLVYIPAFVVLFFLWTYIGIAVLLDRAAIKSVRIAHDYAYGLILDGGWKPNFGRFPPDLVPDQGDAVTIQMFFRNVSHGPLKIRVEDFRVVLDGRTNQDSEGKELLMARLASKILASGGIPWDKNKSRISGTASIKILYGPLDGAYERRYALKLNIQIAVDNSTGLMAIQTSDEILHEGDEAYHG